MSDVRSCPKYGPGTCAIIMGSCVKFSKHNHLFEILLYGILYSVLFLIFINLSKVSYKCLHLFYYVKNLS